MTEPQVLTPKRNLSKSVKFNKSATPSTQKKKFSKTPHSSKTHKAEDAPVLKKKRKLSFGSDELTSDKAADTSNINLAPVIKKKKRDKLNKQDENQSATKKPKKEKVTKKSNLSTKKIATKKDIPSGQSNEDELSEKQKNTIFVGNLPSTVNKAFLVKTFSQFGKVESARIRCLPLTDLAKNRRAGAILKQVTAGAGSGFVKFSSLDEATAALKWNGHVLEGRRLRVDLADPEAQPARDNNRAVFLRNLHYELTDDELWDAFQTCGEIESVRIIKDVATYKGRGLGYVNFKAASAVELALKLDGSNVKGRPVKVHRCDKQSGQKKTPSSVARTPFKHSAKKKNKETKISQEFAGHVALKKKGKKKDKLNSTEKKKKKLAKLLTA